MNLETMEIEYNRARKLTDKSDIESLEEAINVFDSLEDYKDSKKFRDIAVSKLNEAKAELDKKMEEDYNRALFLMENKKSAQRLDQAIKLLNDLGDYKDSAELKEKCIELRKKVMIKDKKGLDRFKLLGYLCAGIGVIVVAFLIMAIIWNIVSNGGN